ncbi:hypothetical protein Pmani_028748 [Petrolisthes manimaculis]|uniref:Uncharacterized protein n=1 Tax=Petrolisthes manimaculis TaxID=1843537 RepID=A0AAE1TUJ5_9EUCA|nr:hypothetical protein Pmani_028748 [Petrolisthes manimaculis]
MTGDDKRMLEEEDVRVAMSRGESGFGESQETDQQPHSVKCWNSCLMRNSEMHTMMIASQPSLKADFEFLTLVDSEEYIFFVCFRYDESQKSPPNQTKVKTGETVNGYVPGDGPRAASYLEIQQQQQQHH